MGKRRSLLELSMNMQKINEKKQKQKKKLKKRGKEGKKIINEGRKNEGNGELKKMSKPSCY